MAREAAQPDGYARRLIGTPAPVWTSHLAGLSTPSAIVDDQGVVLAANHAYATLNQVTLDQIVGSHLRTFLPPAFVAQTTRIVVGVVREARPRAAVNMWRGYWWRYRFWPVVRTDGQSVACGITCDPWRPEIMGGTGDSDPEAEELAFHDLADLGALSAREAEVLWMIGKGLSLPAIAKRLSRSPKTIESHVRAVSAKFGLRGRLAIASFAHARGLTHMTLDQVLRVFGNERPAR